jgi:hypothetical protein
MTLLGYFYASLFLIPNSDVTMPSLMKNQVEAFYVNFFSECCGTDLEGEKQLKIIETKYKSCFTKTMIRYGKEGEKIFFYTSNVSSEFQFQEFYHMVFSGLVPQYKLVLVNVLIEYLGNESLLRVYTVPLNLNYKNEISWQKFLEQSYIGSIVQKQFVNPTNSRFTTELKTFYELLLRGLSIEDRRNIIEQTKVLLTSEGI